MCFKMKNFLWMISFKSKSFSDEDRSKKDMLSNALSGKLNVNEEYRQTFRTKSYIEMLDGVQVQREMETSDRASSPSLSLSLSSSSSFSSSTHLSKCLPEPRQELLNDVIGSSNIHHLLIDYFQASSEAYKSCELLLQSLLQTRTNHCRIKRAISLTKRVYDHSGDGGGDHDNRHYSGVIFRELYSFSQLKNPFSIISPVPFRALHDSHLELLQKLTYKGNQIRRKLTSRRIWKRVLGGCFVISNIVVLIALLILALHSLVGIVAAPGLVGCFVSLVKKRDHHKLTKIVSLELICRQMDIAARAAYIMINDFDTLSRMVARLDGEVEHLNAIAKMCIKSRKCEILKEAVKEFAAQDDAIVEQMGELEQHIYLCFLTINRSRRLVMQEITEGRHQNG